MAITLGFAELVQQEFQSTMLTLMSETEGGMLLDLCDMREISGAEGTKFNRAKDGKAQGTAPQLLGNSTPNPKGISTGWVECKPDFIYAYEQVKDKEFRITSVGLKGYIPQSLTRQLNKEIDRKILLTVDGNTSVTERSTGNANIADIASITKLIATAKGSRINAMQTPDKRKFVKMVMGLDTYEKIYSNDKLINSDYIGNGNTNSSSFDTFYGAEVVVIKEKYMNDASTPAEMLPEGTVYFIPSMTIGGVKWSGADTADASYDLKNADQWSFVAKKSFNAVAVEPESIIRVVAK